MIFVEGDKLGTDHRSVACQIVVKALEVGDQLILVEQKDVIVESLFASDSIDRRVELASVGGQFADRKVEITET